MSRRAVVACALLAAGVAVACASAAPPPLAPIAKVQVGAQSGMVLSAGGSVWTSDLVLARVVRINPGSKAVVRRITLATRPLGIA
jgi:hypothetical protein